MDNERRAAYGFLAARAGTPDYGRNGDDADGLRTDVSDTLANILHYCKKHEIDFDLALDAALVHFDAEVRGDD